MYLCRRRKQPVDYRKRIRHVQPAPFLSDRPIYVKDPVAVVGDQAAKPSFEGAGGREITSADAFYTSSNLTERHHTEPYGLGIERGEP